MAGFLQPNHTAMKRSLLMLLAILFATPMVAPVITAGNSSGDLQAQSVIRYGLKGGVNLANVTPSEDGIDTRTGGTMGVSLTVTPAFFPLGIETGLYYSQKGFESTVGPFGAVTKIDYLEIPLLARLDLLPLPILSPHLLAGPYIGFNVNSRFEPDAGDSGFQLDSVDLKDDTRSSDLGLMFGAGSDFNLGITSLSLQARYSLGLQSIMTAEDPGDNKHSVFSIVLGINF